MSKGFQKGHKRFENANSFKSGKENPAHGKNQTSEANYNWKGNNAGKRAMHKWVEKWKGKPNKCDVCGTIIASRYDWSNVDHKYARVLDDYTRMCRKCHFKYDQEKFKNRLRIYENF